MVGLKVLIPLLLVSLALGDHGSRRGPGPRRGRQQGFGGNQYNNGANGGSSGVPVSVPGGVDFSNCQPDDNGLCCVTKESTVTSLEKEPVLECNHKNVEKCHYTYVTRFNPAQEEVCEENFEKKCQITFRQVAQRDRVQKCLTPLTKVCDQSANQPSYGQPQYGGGRGNNNNAGAEEECRTFYESSCTTRYVEKQPGKFVGDTQCEKKPIEMCGQGCRMEQGEPECHDKEVDVLVDVPEEVCDLNPQKTCRFVTRLVPSLEPEHECTIVPQEICNLRFEPPQEVDRPLKTKWCIDPNAPVEKGETYEESAAAAAPVSNGYGAAASAPQSYAQPAPAGNNYGAPAQSAPQGYNQPSAPAAPASQGYSQPAAPAPQGYSQPAAPAPQGYSQPAAQAPQGYGQPAAQAPQGYNQPAPAAPAPQNYGQPAAQAPQGYSQPAAAPAPQEYAQPAAPAPQGYNQPAPSAPAPQNYGQPAAPAPQNYGQPAAQAPESYSQPAAPAPQNYGQPAAPAPQGYGQPSAQAPDSYSQPAAAPAAPSYSQPSAPAPAPSSYSQPQEDLPVYYKPAPNVPVSTYTKPAPAPAPKPSYGSQDLPTYGRRYKRRQDKV